MENEIVKIDNVIIRTVVVIDIGYVQMDRMKLIVKIRFVQYFIIVVYFQMIHNKYHVYH